jgi:hypothetical protein
VDRLGFFQVQGCAQNWFMGDLALVLEDLKTNPRISQDRRQGQTASYVLVFLTSWFLL